MQRRGIVGRADLLRVLVAHERSAAGEEGRAIVAELLGYECEPAAPIVEARVEPPKRAAEPAPAPASAPAGAVLARGVSFWQPRELVWHDERARAAVIRRLAPRKSDAEAEADERARMQAVAPPPVPHLSPDRRLGPLLERAIVAELPGRELDVDALVRRIGRGEWLGALPWLRRRGWPSLVVLMDRDFGLVPFWRDEERLLALLRRLVGAVGLVVRLVDERGPEARLLDTCGRPVAAREGATAGLPVLALTDLGWYRGAEHQRAWLRVGRRLRRAGERIHALVPVPPARWTRAISQVWAPLAWERPMAGDRAAMNPERRAERVGRLLALAACAQRLEPGLLRALRRLLPRDEADVGTEADAWLHEDMAGSFPTATVMRGERVAAWRAAMAREDEVLKERLRDVLRAWHWHRERQPELWHAEALAMARVMPGVVGEQQRDEAEAFARRLGSRARALAQREDGRSQLEGIGRWLDHVEQHAPAELWSTETSVGRDLQIAWWATHDDDRPPPSPDPSLRGVARGMEREREQRVELWQVGRRVVAGGGLEGVGSPVGVIAAVDQRGYVVEVGGASRAVRVDAPVWLEGKPASRVELRTDRMTLRLEALEKPEWASAIGRDRFGLWAETRVGEVRFRMRWIAPGRFVMGSPEDERGRQSREGPQHEVTITRGFWLGETPVTQALWDAVTGESPSDFKGADRPVENVSWAACRDRLVAGLNEAIGGDDGSFRLPMEAEWEYACRAGTTTARYASPHGLIAWFSGNSEEHTHPVKQKHPNAWGLYDMLGNVWEWCQDCWDDDDYRSSEAQQDPSGPPTGETRIIRGGSWIDYVEEVRAAARGGIHPGFRYPYLGLRLARDQTPVLPTGSPQGGPEDPRREGAGANLLVPAPTHGGSSSSRPAPAVVRRVAPVSIESKAFDAGVLLAAAKPDDLLDFEDLDDIDLGGDDAASAPVVGLVHDAPGEGPEDMMAALRFNEGQIAVTDARWDEAVALLEEAYERGFDVAELHATLAYARFHASGQDEQTALHAFELLDYAQAMDPSLDLVHAYRAAIHRAQGDIPQAREALDRAFELNPYCEFAMLIMDEIG